MPLRENLLTACPGSNPSGENLRYAPVYDKIKEARRKEDVVAQGDWSRPNKEADYPLVIKLASDALAAKSKDLQLAAWLAEAMVYREGFAGLTQALDLLRGLIENFWETVYPEPEDGDLELRAAPLVWVGDYRDLERAVRNIPVTSGGKDFFKYRESLTVPTEADGAESNPKMEARNQAISEGKLTPEEFETDLSATPAAYLEQLRLESEQALESVARLKDICDERFGDVAPSFRALQTAIEDVQQVVRILLARKRENEPEETAYEPEAADASIAYEEHPVMQVGGGGAAAVRRAPARQSLTVEPADRDDAIQRIVTAAKYLRSEDATNPAPYLIVRALRWGELRAQGQDPIPEMLEAPPTQVRQEIKRLMLEGSWDQALESIETAMSMPYGRGWLDLQRYLVRACFEMGSAYDAVSSAVSSELRALLEHMPGLPQMTLTDDTPTANGETQSWLSQLAQTPAPEHQETIESLASIRDDAPEDALREEIPDAYELALQGARSGDVEEAMQILVREMAHEASGRGRFLRRLQLAQICMSCGRQTAAHAMLQELANEIETRKLQEWEPAETIVQALAMLFQCMGKFDASDEAKRKIYLQICKLDPVQAARLVH